MARKKIIIGIIGGSGLDDPKILLKPVEKEIETPYGKTSDKLVMGKIAGKEVVVLSRHGKQHSLSPSLVPYRANIWALKSAGCTHILATTACGSLKEEMKPGNLVFIDQFIDFTKHRKSTFFEDKVVHTPMAGPFDTTLRSILIEAAQKLRLSYHPKGTVVTIEGPRFSSRAESYMFQRMGGEIINMSTIPEVVLSNELGIPYQSIAMVTDYDCWKEKEASVTYELITKRMKKNAEKVRRLLIETINML